MANSVYLNRENRWDGANLSGLEIEGGRLRLASLPGLDEAPPADLATLPEPAAPAGIALDRAGTLYYTEPDADRVMRLDGCDGAVAPFIAAGLEQPRGLAIHLEWNALLVADTGNNRVVAFDLVSRETKTVWTGFDQPLSIVVDAAGSIYIADQGRVQKFDIDGRPDARFHLDQAPAEPIALALDSAELFILDRGRTSIVVVNPAGAVLRTFELNLERPMGLAAGPAGIFAGDNARRRIVKFSRVGVRIGDSPDYKEPIAALALDAHSGLLVHTGAGILRLAATGRYVRRGIAWMGPFANPSVADEQWHRLKAWAALPPADSGSHLQLFVGISQSDTGLPVDPASDAPFANPAWAAIAPDVLDAIVPGAASQRLSLGMEFTSEGRTTPVVEQARLEFDHATYLPFLPAIYRDNKDSGEFLARFLGLFQSMFEDVEGRIDNIPALFDPQAAPADLLRWLAGWLALELNGTWSDETRRKSIARAFEVYSRRGTVEGLRGGLRFYLGVDAHIQEPIVQTNWWALAADDSSNPVDASTSLLGFSTVLAAAEPQGAVAGTTAVLDASHLIGSEELGSPLFDDAAHRFCVQIYRGGRYTESLVAEVRAFLDREKPAHTEYHLAVIEPRMSVGRQARVGIDTVISGPAEASKLGAPGEGGLVLGGEPAGRVGESRVGSTSRLGG